MLLLNASPLYANNLINKHELTVEKPDSVKVNTIESVQGKNNPKNSAIKSSKSTAALSYNIVYYLISKIIQITTISRSQ